MEYVQGGELFDFIVSRGRLPPDEARQFFHQVSMTCHLLIVCHLIAYMMLHETCLIFVVDLLHFSPRIRKFYLCVYICVCVFIYLFAN